MCDPHHSLDGGVLLGFLTGARSGEGGRRAWTASGRLPVLRVDKGVEGQLGGEWSFGERRFECCTLLI